MAENRTEKKILNKFEWFLLAFALSILGVVFLQNMGYNVVETTEKIEYTEAEHRAMEADQNSKAPEVNTLYEKKSEVRKN